MLFIGTQFSNLYTEHNMVYVAGEIAKLYAHEIDAKSQSTSTTCSTSSHPNSSSYNCDICTQFLFFDMRNTTHGRASACNGSRFSPLYTSQN